MLAASGVVGLLIGSSDLEPDFERLSIDAL